MDGHVLFVLVNAFVIVCAPSELVFAQCGGVFMLRLLSVLSSCQTVMTNEVSEF